MHISCSPQETNIENGYDHETGSTYVPKATSSSSQRIQAGYMKAQTQPNSRHTAANQRRRKMRKYASHQRVYQQCRRAPEELFRDFDPKSKDCYVFDVTMSMVMILKHQACEVDEEVVVYFCFPRLSIAVPLRPGDILLFNALEPHPLSSHRNIEDELVCMSLYYKAAVAGLNDNSMPLTKT
jgi:hypothetical protein